MLLYLNGMLIWPSLNVLGFAKMFLAMLPDQNTFNPSPAPSAGPVIPPSDISNFAADTPTGAQMVQAQYIMYAPYGPTPEPFSSPGSGIVYDMYKYSWWWGQPPTTRRS